MRIKKILTGILAAALVCSAAACGSAKDEKLADTQTENNMDKTEEGAAEETRVITDALGREVEIPAVVERIVPLGNAARLGTYLGVQDKFVTISEGDLSENPFMAYGWYNHDLWKELPVASSGGYGVFHPEVILEADPDVILCTYEPDIVESIEEATGIPVVAAAQGKLFAEDYEQSLRIFGEVCGVSDRAEEVIGFIHTCLDDLNNRTKDLAQEEKPLVLGAAATFRGGHGISGVYVDYPVFGAIAANDAAVGLEKADFDTGVEVDKEKILEWDPEIIFLDAGNMGLVETEYKEDPGFFQQLSAVKNGQVYQWPNSTANYTNLEIPLVSAYYAGSILYPEAFEDINFEEKAAEIFKFFLGHEDFLKVLEENNGGYKKITLGES